MDIKSMEQTCAELRKYGKWADKYTIACETLLEELSDILSYSLLLRWQTNANFPGIGKLQLPDRSIRLWLQGMTNLYPDRLNIFWRILEDQSKATEEDKELAEKVKNIIRNNLVGCLFIIPY